MNRTTAVALAAAFVLAAPQAFAAPTAGEPPAGNVIFQLTGNTINGTYQQGTASFVADSTNINLAFAFRDDPSYIYLSNVSLVDTTTSSSNLLTNSDFSGGTFTVNGQTEPDGWTYLNIFGADAGGEVDSSCGLSAANCYDDGAVGAYDGINQVVSTTAGDTYSVSFYYYEDSGESTYATDYQDMFVYAGDAAPTAAPEPASLALLASGILGMTFLRRRRSH